LSPVDPRPVHMVEMVTTVLAEALISVAAVISNKADQEAKEVEATLGKPVDEEEPRADEEPARPQTHERTSRHLSFH
jgi:hypothetical protein